ncbi:hypothetical protein, partial [Streptomyces sp. NPDC004538]|uniref:hypothetical protein n=1 Tax=Streptomyces sp. NPDC004538 TaxID=3154279 RepID=UPI0033BD1CCB
MAVRHSRNRSRRPAGVAAAVALAALVSAAGPTAAAEPTPPARVPAGFAVLLELELPVDIGGRPLLVCGGLTGRTER